MSVDSKTPLALAFRSVGGGWRNYIEYAGIAARNGSIEMQRLIAAYEALLPGDRRVVSPEQLCDLARVKPSELVGAVCGAIWETQSTRSSLVSAMAHPQMIETTLKFGRDQENHKDRELFFRLTGSLPDKKGVAIVVNNNPQTAVLAMGSTAVKADELPDMDAEVVEMSRLIGAPQTAIDLSPQPDLEPADDEDEDGD